MLVALLGTTVDTQECRSDHTSDATGGIDSHVGQDLCHWCVDGLRHSEDDETKDWGGSLEVDVAQRLGHEHSLLGSGYQE